MKLSPLLLDLAKAEYCAEDECHFELRLQYRLTMSCLNPADNFWYPVKIDENGKTVHHFHSAIYPPNGTVPEDDSVEVPNFKPWLYNDHVFDESMCVYGDGGKTGIVTINDQHPGPVIEVNKDALVHVTVKNELLGGTAASIHFHGFKFDQGYSWYDGVAMLTQCPITSGQKFTYSFIASEVGLRWYHGHGSGLKVDGLNTRWYMEDGVSTTSSTIDSLLINGRQATMDNNIPMHTYDMRENKELHLVCSSIEFGI